jgi:hypothetical protein
LRNLRRLWWPRGTQVRLAPGGGFRRRARDLFSVARHYIGVGKHEKLFRAIVVMGAAMTAPACDDDRCFKCVPPPSDAVPTDTVATTDAPPKDAGPSDAPVDVVLIL